MQTFDDLAIYRPQLARSYLQLLEAQPGRPIALFAARRVGKTFFLDHDLTPAAKKAGLAPVYADIWLHKASPLEAINHALEEALDDVRVPTTAAGKIAKTRVKKVAGLGASVEFGDEPRRRSLPEKPELRLDALVARLAAESGATVLLMLDEIQALGDLADGQSTIASLRAVLQKRKREVRAVLTGSSQEGLAAMMVAAGGPMYQFAQLLDFPVLGEEYLKLLADHYATVHHNKHLDLAALQRVFERIGFKPALMKDLVKTMSADGITDVELALQRFAQDERQIAGWQSLLNGMAEFERALMILIAQGKPPMGKDTLYALARIKGANPTIGKIRAALERMKRAGILAKRAGASYVIEDRLFANHIAAMPIAKRP
jgi:hypothetical protein